MANPVDQLAALCAQAMNPNTELVRSAVADLNKGLKNAQSIMLFLALLQTNPNVDIQQFAAIVMRKRVGGLYLKLSRPDQRALTSSLTSIISNPQYSVVVLRSVVDVAVTLAKLVVPRDDWPEFLPFVLSAVSTPASPDQRALAMYMLTSVLESLGDKLREHYRALHTLLADALRDADASIRSSAMRATSMIIPWLVTKEEIAQYSTLIPMIVDVLRHFLTTGDDEEAIETFSILGDLVETPIPVITKYIPALVNLMLETSVKTEIDFQVRQSALSFVQLVVSVKPKLIVKHKLVTPILAAAFTMCAEGEGNNEAKQEKEEEEESMSPHVFGAQLIDSLALALPVKHVVGPALSFVAQYGRPEMHFRQRRAAVTAVTVLTEGCAEAIKDTLATVVPFVVGALADPSFLVRQSACLAVGQCADNLQPEIIEYHGTIIPALLQGLRDSKDSVVHRCCYALEAFCETLGDRIVPYLAPFMDNMGVVMRKDTEVQEMAISAISSTSVAAGKQFAPYFPAVYELLRSMMMATGLGSADPDKILVLRARATECVGLCALAVGDAAKGVVQEAMTLALSGLELEFAELNEFTFGFFCNIAELLKGEFANFLPTVMPHIWKACQSTDGVIPAAQQQGLEIDGDEDDDIDVSVRTSFLDEKSAACQAIGSFANHVRAQFIPYVDQSIQCLNPLLRYFHETVRASAIESIQLIACAIHDAFPPAAPYKNGDLSIPLSSQSYEYSVRVLPVFISALKDKSPDVVTRANDSIGEIAQLLGPVAINEFVPAIKDEFLSILQQQAPCQTKFTEGDELEDSDDEYDEEQEEEDDDDSRFLSLLDNVTECMVDIAHALGTLFVPYMDALFPLLMKYSRKSAHHSLRSTSIGAMAETINGANALPSSPEMITQLCQLGLMGLTNSGADPDIQRTSAFLCGVLVELGGNNMESFVLQILQGIHPLYSSADPTVIDNACGAVARIVSAFPNSPHVPLEHILPILLPSLPIKRDHQEDEPVWKCVGMLCGHPKIVGAGEGAVGAVLGAVVKAVEQQPPLEEAVLARLRNDITAALPLLQPVVAQSPALSPLLQAILSKLNVQ